MSTAPDAPFTRWLDGREDVQEFSSLQEAGRSLGSISGYFSIAREDRAPLDFQWDYRGYETTLVLFHAALGAGEQRLPVFLGQNVSSEVEANRLFVSDPAHYCAKTNGIGAGWFMGTATWPDYQRELGLFLAQVQRTFGERNFILFGPSAGGFAALFFSALLPGSTAVAMNPQIDVADFNAGAAAALCHDAWGVGEWRYAPLRYIPAISEVSSMYSHPTLNRVLYIQNEGDYLHVRDHYEPFRSSVHPSNEIEFLTGNWGQGHKPTPVPVTRAILEGLCSGESLRDIVTAHGDIASY